jgi:hypothetical protein
MLLNHFQLFPLDHNLVHHRVNDVVDKLGGVMIQHQAFHLKSDLQIMDRSESIAKQTFRNQTGK